MRLTPSTPPVSALVGIAFASHSHIVEYLKKLSFRFLFEEKVETIGVFAAAFGSRVSGEK